MALTDYAGLKLWLRDGVGMSTDTAGATPVTTTGQAVARWADQSGQGNHVTQATLANRPLYQSAGTAGLDGHASALWDTTDILDGGAALQFSGRTGLTVFAVVHQTTTPSVNCAIIGRDSSSSRGWLCTINSSTGKAVWIISSSTTARNRRDGSKVDCRGLPCVLTFRYNGPAGEQSIRVNGADDTGAQDFTVPATIGGNGPALLVGNDGFAEPLRGHLAEVAVYDVALSDADRDAIEAEFLVRYRLMMFLEGSASPNTDCHQGYAWGGAKHFTVDTGKIERRADDASWTVEATNSAPMSGLAGANHLGDPCYHGGKLYAPVEAFPGTCPPTAGSMKIAVYDATTLARDSAADISAQGHEVSSIAVDPDAGILWVASWCDGTKLWKYRLSDRAYVGSVSLASTIDRIQGLAWRAGVLYASTGEGATTASLGAIWRIDPATGACRMAYHDARRGANVSHEGMDWPDPATLRWLIDELNGGGGSKFVRSLAVVYPASPPTAGVATVTGVTATTASLSATAATGAAHGSAWSYQWSRSADSGATWADVSGATALTLTDTGLTTGATYLYRIRAADGDNPPNIVYSNSAAATPVVTTGYYAGAALAPAGGDPIYYAF